MNPIRVKIMNIFRHDDISTDAKLSEEIYNIMAWVPDYNHREDYTRVLAVLMSEEGLFITVSSWKLVVVK